MSDHRHLRVVPPLSGDRKPSRAEGLRRIKALEAKHGDLVGLIVADHEAAHAWFGTGDLERAADRLEELLTGRDEPRGCNCRSSWP